jgi:hypothetical protein
MSSPAKRIVRRSLATDQPVNGDWFVTNGVSASERVVITGAQTLLSEEFKATFLCWQIKARPCSPVSLTYHCASGASSSRVSCHGLRFVCGHANGDVYFGSAPPQVVIQTEAPDFRRKRLNNSSPVRWKRTQASPGLETIRSQSIQGLSAIVLVFREDADIFKVRQLVTRKRLTEVAGELPQGVKAPKIGAAHVEHRPVPRPRIDLIKPHSDGAADVC